MEKEIWRNRARKATLLWKIAKINWKLTREPYFRREMKYQAMKAWFTRRWG